MIDCSRSRLAESTHRAHAHVAYGLTIDSDVYLNLPAGTGSGPAVRLFEGHVSQFAAVKARLDVRSKPDDFYQYGFAPDGTAYVAWDGVGEFLIGPDGRDIAYIRHALSEDDSFHVYLLGQALSFSLLRLGFEPLHATSVVVDGRALALLGGSGYGKSTLAAAFIAVGHPLLTDDVQVIQLEHDTAVAYPGPARIKLFPESAAVLGHYESATALNPGADKLIIRLDSRRSHPDPVPLGAIVSIVSPDAVVDSSRVSLRRLSQQEGAMALVRHTFNSKLRERDRLARQFDAAVALARTPMFELARPCDLNRLSEVVRVMKDEFMALPSGAADERFTTAWRAR